MRSIHLGVVSYLNAKPLLYGLENQADLRLTLEVPARLLDGLRSAAFDVALLPVIDYQAMDGLKIVPSGGIGCDGPTLTVRIFSPVPIGKIQSLDCDAESHTSVALARIILSERYGIKPKLGPGEARLLIGDKVITDAPPGMPHELDLGAAWKELTGLPFVFAAWTARSGVDLRDLPARLTAAREQGANHIEEIVARYAAERGWPPGLARDYLGSKLKFAIGPQQIRAIGMFHEMAGRLGIIPAPAKPIKLH